MIAAASSDFTDPGVHRDHEAEVLRVVGFGLGGWMLATPVDSLREVCHVLPSARVPGAKPWLIGVADYHGRILPITDLQAYFFARPTPSSDATRLFVVQHETLLCGLLIEAVHGLKHVPPSAIRAMRDPGPAPSALRACLRGGLTIERRDWWQWDPGRLLVQPEFGRATVRGRIDA